MFSYSYKQLSKTNIKTFKELLRVFGEAFDEIKTYQNKIPRDNYLTALLSNSDFIGIVALNNKEVIGGLTAYVLNKFEQERSEIYIYDLAVSKNNRRKGVATNLIKELKKIAKKKGSYVIFVQADKGDNAAIKLYESLGTRESVYHYDIRVK